MYFSDEGIYSRYAGLERHTLELILLLIVSIFLLLIFLYAFLFLRIYILLHYKLYYENIDIYVVRELE